MRLRKKNIKRKTAYIRHVDSDPCTCRSCTDGWNPCTPIIAAYSDFGMCISFIFLWIIFEDFVERYDG